MIAAVLSPFDPQWRQLLDRAPHDVYHLPEYAVVAARYEHGEPVALFAEDGGHAILLPLLIRELPAELAFLGESRDATSAYGYSGPVATPNIPVETVRRALVAFEALARQRALVTAFIRLHPLRPVPLGALAEFGTLVNHGQIVYVDLSKTVEQLWTETRSNHRRNINRLSQLGYRVDVDDWGSYPDFQLLYRTTMDRRAARAFYYFTDSYFDELRQMLGDRLHLLTVRAPTGDIAAAGLFTLVDGIAEYHLGGTAEDYLSLAPSKLMFDVARRWAKGLGASVLNLGGGVGASSGPLHQFKTGFSPSQADFHTVRVVFDEAQYQRLTDAHRERYGLDAGPDDFFPAYRRPVHTVAAE